MTNSAAENRTKSGSPAFSMIQGRRPAQRFSFSREFQGISRVRHRRRAAFIESAGEPLLWHRGSAGRAVGAPLLLPRLRSRPTPEAQTPRPVGLHAGARLAVPNQHPLGAQYRDLRGRGGRDGLRHNLLAAAGILDPVRRLRRPLARRSRNHIECPIPPMPSSIGRTITTNGRIIMWSSCSSTWQW